MHLRPAANAAEAEAAGGEAVMTRPPMPPRPIVAQPRPKSPAEVEFERLARENPGMSADEAARRIKVAGLSWAVPK